MLIQRHQTTKFPMILNLILVILVCVTSPVNSTVESRKLDETSVPTTNECTPCGGGGYSSPPPLPPSPPPPSPPPPIVYPSPPPPVPIYPSPPPPSPKKPPSQYCPPPPPSSPYIYITGPPGNLYPVDENFNGGASRHGRIFAALILPLLVGSLSLMAFW